MNWRIPLTGQQHQQQVLWPSKPLSCGLNYAPAASARPSYRRALLRTQLQQAGIMVGWIDNRNEFDIHDVPERWHQVLFLARACRWVVARAWNETTKPKLRRCRGMLALVWPLMGMNTTKSHIWARQSMQRICKICQECRMNSSFHWRPISMHISPLKDSHIDLALLQHLTREQRSSSKLRRQF